MSGATTRRRAVTSVVIAALLVGAAGSTSAPAAHPDPAVRDLDLVASANPTAAEPVVADDAFADDGVFPRRTVKSDVAATGSATCDGCDATSTALQVLYVNRGRQARLDNTAAAWTQACTDCAARALSVQVVVLRGVPSIVPNNRALAVNAACSSCQATGVAYQLVVASRRANRLSGGTLAELRAWVAEQAAALRVPEAAPPSRLSQKKADRRARRVAVSELATLEDLVTDDLDAVTVSADVELNR
ncbi:hypothetical protein GCM10023350_41410 [Nocardioides endophyticus]|uniref:Uncharacterized protein n=1 Tax=Nocardioides endophyticus TaxID=1353775 RepID=A0ABP8ZBG9_9ACTN